MQQVLATKRVAFVVGCPHSGTDWLAHMLAEVPQLAVGGEGHFGDRLVPQFEHGFDLYNAAVTGSGDPDHPRVFQIRDRLLAYRQLCDAALFRYVASVPNGHDAVCIVDTTAEHAQVLPLLYTLYPQAQVINVLRDPRDAAVSAYVHNTARGQQEPLLRFAVRFLRMTWPQHVLQARETGAAVGMGRYTELRYEDLCTRPRMAVETVLRFLGVAADEQTVARALQANDAEHVAEQPGGQDEVGEWRHHLLPAFVQEHCAPVRDTMEQLGYRLDEPVDQPQASQDKVDAA